MGCFTYGHTRSNNAHVVQHNRHVAAGVALGVVVCVAQAVSGKKMHGMTEASRHVSKIALHVDPCKDSAP